MGETKKTVELAEARARKFARVYVEKGMNATATIKELRPHITYGSARELGARELAIVGTQKAITEVMEEMGLNDELAEKYHKKNLVQRANIAASNTALELYHELKGNLNRNAQHNHLHLHSDLPIDEQIKELQKELGELQGDNGLTKP